MVTVEVASADPLEVSADTLVVGVFTGGIEGPGVEPVLAALGLAALPQTPQFRGDIGQHIALAAPGQSAATVLFVGLGRMVATDAERLRRAAMVAASSGGAAGRVVTTLALVHPTAQAVGAIAEGFRLGIPDDPPAASAGDRPPAPERLTILVPSAALTQGAQAVRRSDATVAATLAARRLIDTPPGDRRPPALAARLTRLTRDTCGADVHHAEALEQAGFGALLSLGRGSPTPPCLVELRYEPADPLGHVVLCGKGTTFGSGGLALHRGDRLTTGKVDVAGAAVVAAACSVLGDLDVRVRVTALLPLVESMPDGDAQRPGDVVTTRAGATIEITDGGADTALALADTLDLARTYEPDAIVGVATGGPAASTALGRFAGAVTGTDQELVDSLLVAAERAGEPLWQLPLWDELDRFVDSPIADMANHAARAAGTPITTALILRRFTKGVSWAHIDCGGPSHLPAELDGGAHRTGATGYGVRTLLAWLEHRTAHVG